MEYQTIANRITKVSKMYNKIIQRQLQMKIILKIPKERYLSPIERHTIIHDLILI